MLKSIPNTHSVFERVDWRKCQDKFLSNVDTYIQHKDAWRYNSASDEEHTEWQDLMEDIRQRMFPDDKLPTTNYVDLTKTSDFKQTEQDLKIAGELMRDRELSNYKGRKWQPKNHNRE